MYQVDAHKKVRPPMFSSAHSRGEVLFKLSAAFIVAAMYPSLLAQSVSYRCPQLENKSVLVNYNYDSAVPTATLSLEGARRKLTLAPDSTQEMTIFRGGPYTLQVWTVPDVPEARLIIAFKTVAARDQGRKIRADRTIYKGCGTR
jgi:hypothetical protein